ncbi:MAG: CapA family protein [Christensenellales bacterium]
MKKIARLLAVVLLLALSMTTFAGAEAAITDKAITVKSVSLSYKTLPICLNKSFQLTAKVKPGKATNSQLLWTSSDPEKVSVTQDGRIEAKDYTLKPVRITARSLDGSKKKSTCLVTVKDDVKVSSVKFRKKSVSVYFGNPIQLTCAVVPPTAKDASLTFMSSNPSVAEVDENGIVTPKKDGKTTIRATANDGSGKFTTCKVTVKRRPVKKVRLNEKVLMVDEGATVQLSATVLPENASFPEVEWTSSNEAVATVDQSGFVTVKGGGVAKITAAADRGRVKATCKIRVKGENTRRLVISAVGDCMMGGDPRPKSNRYAKDPGSRKRFQDIVTGNGGLSSIFSKVEHVFKNDDVTVVNLECALTTKTKYRSVNFVLVGNPAFAKTMKQSGIEAAAVANNHSRDAGMEGYEQTLTALKRNGIVPSGYFASSYISKKGVRIGFLGVAPVDHRMSRMKTMVKKIASKCRFLIVSIHWSEPEFQYNAPSDAQRAYARAAIDAGADLVLGTHTHRVNGIEQYKGKHIVYDLGNFVTCINNPSNTDLNDRDTFIFQEIHYVFDDGYTEFDRIRVIPAAYSSSSDSLDLMPMLYSGSADKNRVFDKIQRYSNIPIPRD